jgi:alkanesulfonate monooxygenase SsuD/methylene tetrahydromethanopterin reductase-like flavin-dependent oxidoreductase (luciferase family)
VSLIGTEAEVLEGMRAFAEAGATDFAPVELTLDPDDAAATRELLKGVAADGIG